MPYKKEIERVMEILIREFGEHSKPTVRSTEKETPFRTLIACLLSLRTQDKNTKKAAGQLFAVADTPQTISKIPLKKLERLIYSSGYYKNKAKTIKHVSKIILNEYKGKVPKDFDKLMEIKGIGRKTANIVMSYGHGMGGFIAIDTHCHRIPNRLGWMKTKNPEETEFEIKKILPKKYWYEFNTLFILFGQNICKPIKPLCFKCPIESFCEYENKNLQQKTKILNQTTISQ